MAKGIKTGGRQKGTSNKLTGTTRELISQIVTHELKKLPELLEQMEPKEKADCIFKLLPYVSPKMISLEEPQKEKQLNLHRMMHPASQKIKSKQG